jgi:hypothetical protein
LISGSKDLLEYIRFQKSWETGSWCFAKISTEFGQTAQGILNYQKTRIADVSGRTVHLKVGLLRRILKKNRAWSKIADDDRNLPERTKEAKVLTQYQNEALLEMARTKPEWNIAYCAAVLALNTTCRSCE